MFNTLANTIETTVAEVATSEVAAETVKLGFTTENMRESLLCMGAGMIGIFIVVGIITHFKHTLLSGSCRRQQYKNQSRWRSSFACCLQHQRQQLL